jgi:ApaG protein
MPHSPATAAMPRPELQCRVHVQYLPEQSQPPDGPYAYAYTVTILNTGDVAAQVVARHWRITDARGHTEDVRGLAVMGQQPLLKPGERHEYTSWTQIATPQGSMRGRYLCVTEHAEAFDAEVPEFALARPDTLH